MPQLPYPATSQGMLIFSFFMNISVILWWRHDGGIIFLFLLWWHFWAGADRTAQFSYFTDENIKGQREGACPKSQLACISSFTGREFARRLMSKAIMGSRLSSLNQYFLNNSCVLGAGCTTFPHRPSSLLILLAAAVPQTSWYNHTVGPLLGFFSYHTHVWMDGYPYIYTQLIIIIPFFRWTNWDSEARSKFFRFTESAREWEWKSKSVCL